VGGLFSGFAGAILSVDYTQTWANEMTKGRGFVAVGLVIVARWNPNLVLPVVLCGVSEAATLRLAGHGPDAVALSDRMSPLRRLPSMRRHRLSPRNPQRRNAGRTCVGFRASEVIALTGIASCRSF
jgi:hypothetical protein